VGDWRSAAIALKTVKESHDRWKEANRDRFQQEWENRQFFSKLKNGLLPHPD
jgi:hypothetical protein